MRKKEQTNKQKEKGEKFKKIFLQNFVFWGKINLWWTPSMSGSQWRSPAGSSHLSSSQTFLTFDSETNAKIYRPESTHSDPVEDCYEELSWLELHIHWEPPPPNPTLMNYTCVASHLPRSVLCNVGRAWRSDAARVPGRVFLSRLGLGQRWLILCALYFYPTSYPPTHPPPQQRPASNGKPVPFQSAQDGCNIFIWASAGWSSSLIPFPVNTEIFF